MHIQHTQLRKLLQQAYSAERAAAFAYIGHAANISDTERKARVKQIEIDEWEHRENVLGIMNEYEVPVSRWLEIKFWLIGKFISLSCYVIGDFMAYFFAGKLESGNVCEYFSMMRYFHELGIEEHDEMLFEMGIKEKEHEVFFIECCKDSSWFIWFEKIFRWGENTTDNDVDLEDLRPVKTSDRYCVSRKAS